MKAIVWSISVLFSLSVFSNPEREFRTVNNIPFVRGERLEFVLSYSFINCAKIVMEITDEKKEFRNRPTYHMIGTGKTLGGFNWLFKVDDRYESYMDDQAMFPWYAVRKVDEDGFKMQQSISYLQHKNVAKIEGKEYSIDENAQDLLGAFYYCRTMDFSKAKPGDIFTIPTFFDFENHNLQVKFLGKEEISTSFGKFNTLKVMPIVQEGRVFKEKEDMNIWLSDDENKVPIRLKTDLLFGHLKADLVVAKNLKKPLNRVK